MLSNSMPEITKNQTPGIRQKAEGKSIISLVGPRGLEPLTSSTSRKRSSQLS